ncbi:MAG TPA: hypothetical protein VFZ22_18505 [Pyrinomonadaceae bacterium]|nr:hypothetical protein [Pyrinomonadaceae bacterium]
MENEKSKAGASPASVARTLADRGVTLVHPDVLNEDVRWRSARLFTAEELNFHNIAGAITWMETLAARPDREDLRPAVLSLKRELDLIVAGARTTEHDRRLAGEVRQWLTVWLQNPQIFPDWFSLRQNANDFRERFGS